MIPSTASSFPGRADQNRPAWILISPRIFSRNQALYELSTLHRGILVPEVSQHLQPTLKNAAANSRLPIESDRRMSSRVCNHHLGLASRTVLDGNPIRAKHQHHTSREQLFTLIIQRPHPIRPFQRRTQRIRLTIVIITEIQCHPRQSDFTF